MELVLGAVAIFGIAGIAIFWMNQHNKKGNAAAAAWPETSGTIITSEVDREYGDDSDATYSAGIVYTYEVDGKSYKGNRIAYASNGYSSAADAQVVCDRFPVGATVPVYYDPAKPNKAVLERSEV